MTGTKAMNVLENIKKYKHLGPTLTEHSPQADPLRF